MSSRFIFARRLCVFRDPVNGSCWHMLGVMTAAAGGIMRDVICGELPLIPRREIYITAAAAVAMNYVALRLAPVPRDAALPAGIATRFCIRAASILRGWSLPPYRARPARDHPDRR